MNGDRTMEEDVGRTGNICVGGTFSPLHRGHIALLREAFMKGKRVLVGLTSDAMASRGRSRKVEPYSSRLRELRRVLDELSGETGVDYIIREINDRFAFALREEVDAIVASRETESTVDEIDEERKKKGLPPLRRYVIDMVMDQGGERISSSRVVKGEIDENGRKLQGSGSDAARDRICIHLGSKNPEKAGGVESAFRRYWPEVQVFQYELNTLRSGEGKGPVSGARERSRKVLERIGEDSLGNNDAIVGVESGTIEEEGVPMMVHCCHIIHRGKEGFGMGSAVEITDIMLDRMMVFRGRTWEFSDIMGGRTSLIESMSGGSLSRTQLVEEACRMALLSLSWKLEREESG